MPTKSPRTTAERVALLKKRRRKVEENQDRYERAAFLYLSKFKKATAKLRYYDRAIEKVWKESQVEQATSKRVIQL
jgi:hypothetical protein